MGKQIASEVLSAADRELLIKINTALFQANQAERAAETAKAELVSRSKALGFLLLEAKKRHPAVKDFEAFLKRTDGLKLSRTYDLLRLAGGRTTDEELRKEARERKRKSRSKKTPQPTLNPSPISVTKPDVTESAERIADKYIAEDGGPPRSAEVSIEQRQAEMAALGLGAEARAAKASAHALAEFSVACRTWLPKITAEADRHRARLLVSELTSNKKTEAA
jgi:hypothetical protein